MRGLKNYRSVKLTVPNALIYLDLSAEKTRRFKTYPVAADAQRLPFTHIAPAFAHVSVRRESQVRIPAHATSVSTGAGHARIVALGPSILLGESCPLSRGPRWAAASLVEAGVYCAKLVLHSLRQVPQPLDRVPHSTKQITRRVTHLERSDLEHRRSDQA